MSSVKENYYNLMIKQLEQVCERKKLLLHTCCAVCASGVLSGEYNGKRLVDIFDITLYFSNSNIDTEKEFIKRAKELDKLSTAFGVSVEIAPYKEQVFLDRVKGLEQEKERGGRCRECIAMRLEDTMDYCTKNDFDFVGSTLTISPHKDANTVNDLGSKICNKKWLYSDFKKKEGFKRAMSVAEELSIYKQNYCGCKFAKDMVAN